MYYKHGLRNHKLYKVWNNMIQRCYNKNHPQYKDYGGRGIRVCIRWQKSFICFYKFCIDNGYKEGLTVDRYPDNNGNYKSSNCRFVTNRINNLNKGITESNTSGYIGVSFRKDRNKYRSYITINGKQKIIGSYKTAKRASMARNRYIGKNNLTEYMVS